MHVVRKEANYMEKITKTTQEPENPQAGPMQQELLNKHYLRKHGPGAYYGQG